MNVPRLLEIALWLANGAPHEKITFDMSMGVSIAPEAFNKKELSDCQTSCCIAGATTQFFGKDAIDDLIARELDFGGIDANEPEVPFFSSMGVVGVFDQARKLLDLTNRQAEQLFLPGGRGNVNFKKYNDPAWAARTICHLIATGNADWDATKEAY